MTSKIRIGVGEFALPVPRLGSIEMQSGYGRRNEGQELHLMLQNQKAEEDSSYQSELKISAEFEREGFQFLVSGKMDGMYSTPFPRIEEIKSTFNIKELAKTLRHNGDHPYCLQLKTYGYFYYLKNGTIPQLNFYLISTRSRATDTLEIELDIETYEAWLNRRLDELAGEALDTEKTKARRMKMAKEFSFPFTQTRPGQAELMQTISDGVSEKKRMLIQAPTGLGKTAGVLFPILKDAISRGQRVIYLTPKNSQHMVAEDAVDRFKETGTKVKSLTITAKSKICFKNEPLCNPEYCEYAKDHYTKFHQFKIKELLSQKRKLTHRVFRKVAEEYQVCPFEIQLEAAQNADVVICDYNYVFGPRTAFGQIARNAIGLEGKPSLVIDEAHNLFSRALGYYSPELSTRHLESMRPNIQEIPYVFRDAFEKLLDNCIETVRNCQPETGEKSSEVTAPIEGFELQNAALKSFLSRYLESDVDIQPRDVVLRLCFYWSEFTESLEFVQFPHREEFFTTYRVDNNGAGTLRIVCCDASEMLKASYDEYEQVVGFSATLKPFDYYAQLSGLDPALIKTAEFSSPFPKQHRKLLIIPEISTKYADRERNYEKISTAIHKISELKLGNYFAFFPSFDFLEKVINRFKAPSGFAVLRQYKDMRAAEIERVIEQLRERKIPTLVFAVQGGVFSEGVDYPGDTVIGAFVVGPPLPPFELEREKMKQYYEEHYESGFAYAYTYPAMAKAVQAAGRVIRSETDKGLIVLMDNRFLNQQYFQSMPTDWFENTPRELVSNQILKSVSNFWVENG